jgi:hypothetical protein
MSKSTSGPILERAIKKRLLDPLLRAGKRSRCGYECSTS